MFSSAVKHNIFLIKIENNFYYFRVIGDFSPLAEAPGG
jgi:hypothetical protein